VAQAIGLLLDIFGLAAAASLATALVLTWLGRRLLPAGLASRFVLPFAVSIAYFAGYAILPRSFASFTPAQGQAWPWLPYLALLGAVFSGVIPDFSRISRRVIALIAIAGVAAAALSPTWPVYGFTQEPLRIFLAIYLLAVGFPLMQKTLPSHNRQNLCLLIAVCVLSTLAIGAIYSTRHARLAALTAGAFTGISIALRFGSKDSDFALCQLAPVFAVLAGGIAWLATVEPDPPEPMLLAVPLLSWALLILPAISRLPFARDGIS
jgi:FtsH-binding integral membrane protein